MNQRWNYAVRSIVCIALAAAMVGVSELLGEKEIIFPEITALTVGAIAAPKHSWKVSRARMIILIAVCSVIGILIVRFSPFPKAVGLTAAFALCQVIYLMSGTSFAPLISAAALPVLMDTETIIYPISAVTMTALTCLAQYILERAGVCEKENFVPLAKPDKFRWISAIVRVRSSCSSGVPADTFRSAVLYCSPASGCVHGVFRSAEQGALKAGKNRAYNYGLRPDRRFAEVSAVL